MARAFDRPHTRTSTTRSDPLSEDPEHTTTDRGCKGRSTQNRVCRLCEICHQRARIVFLRRCAFLEILRAELSTLHFGCLLTPLDTRRPPPSEDAARRRQPTASASRFLFGCPFQQSTRRARRICSLQAPPPFFCNERAPGIRTVSRRGSGSGRAPRCAWPPAMRFVWFWRSPKRCGMAFSSWV